MAVPSESLPPDRAGSPGSMIVTFAGCYLRQVGGWIAVAELIRCLDAVGIGAPAVRQALVRLKSRGFLAPEKRSSQARTLTTGAGAGAGAGAMVTPAATAKTTATSTTATRTTVAGYTLTPAGLADLAIGDRRIFRYGHADEQDGWVLAVFSVPEHQRAQRHQLRSQLSWLGFGTVSAGVRVAPAPLAGPARDLLTATGLDSYVTWFAAHNLGAVDVATWWDLDTLRRLYQGFLARWQPADGALPPAAVTGETAAEAFANYLRLVDDWRLFPRLDPGLPASLLPADWPGPAAWRVFSELRSRWEEPGLGFVELAADLPG